MTAFTRKRKLEGLGPLNRRGENDIIKGEENYAGITIDSKITCTQHLEKMTRKGCDNTLLCKFLNVIFKLEKWINIIILLL